MSSKACIYVLGGAANTAALFDFDGVYILDGGFAEKNPGFVAHVRDVSAVLLAAPTLGNLGTTSALLEQGKPLPVFTNTKPFKTAKPGSSGEIAKAIQEANSKLLSVAPPLFNPKYPAHIIYQSAAKGVLSMYILAGDVKDSDMITKALAGGNEAEVEKAAAENGTIGVLLWRPAMTDQSAVRVLISGTSSLARIQQSLDKAAKSLPFLNAPTVKSKDALLGIPAPAVPRPVAGKPSTRSASTTGAARTRPAVPAVSAPRALTSRAPAGPARPTTTRSATPATRTAVPPRATAPPKAAPASKAPTRAPIPARSAPAPPRGAPAKAPKAEPIAQKKVAGKVQRAAPSKPASAVSAPKATAPASTSSAPATAPEASRRDPNDVTIVLDDSLFPEDFNQGSAPMDIVVIPPTPEPPRLEEARATHPKEPIVDAEDLAKAPHEVDDVANLADVEDEIPPPVDAFKKPEPRPETNVAGGSGEDRISEPVDAFKKPDPVELDDFDPLKPSHPDPSAPVVPSGDLIIATPDPELPNIVAAVPFIPPSPKGPNDGLVKLDDELEKIAPGFEEPLIPQAPRDDGTLAEFNEDVSKLVDISMDTNSAEVAADLAKAVGEVTQLSAELQNLALDEKTDEYVRKLSNQMIEDATLPFTSALASSIVTSNGSETNGHGEQAHAAQNGGIKIPKHDLMQSHSNVIENGAAVKYEKTDPALDAVLNACAQESEQIDASHPENLHMPAAPGSVASAKPVKFARPYYFDVVTVPRNEKLETSVEADGLQEFISKVRSRNVILASKEISGEQLQSILRGKQTWCDRAHPCNVIPTHSSPMLHDFRQKNEEQFAANHLQFSMPVEKQRTTVSSDAGVVEYDLARVDLL